ncbi:hypothetical protein BH09ACT1_BH09ACT1_07880 [soil metagenome]
MTSDDPDARAARRVTLAAVVQLSIGFAVLLVVVLLVALNASVVVAVVAAVVAALLGALLTWLVIRYAVRPLEDTLRMQRALAADTSHELRTPLVVLDARLQFLQRRLEQADPIAPMIDLLRRDTQTLLGIVTDVLGDAEADASRDVTIPVDISPIVLLAVESMRIIAADNDVTIDFQDAPTRPPKPGADPEHPATRVPSASIHRCVVALLQNALDFSPAGSSIRVELTDRTTTMRIAVRDSGPGISGVEPHHVFDRFSRGDQLSRGDRGWPVNPASGSEGVGIGLSLVRDTIERFGGSAAVASTSPGGTEIELIVPLA